MQLDILQLYLNGLVILFHISWNIKIFTWVQSSILNLLKPLFKRCILHLLIYIETHIITSCLTFILEWVNEFFYVSWIINICIGTESFILNVVKSIINELHFAFTTIFWNGYIKTWHISHLYLNGLMIKSKCSCMQGLRCM
jgi:hypothetical protein